MKDWTAAAATIAADYIDGIEFTDVLEAAADLDLGLDDEQCREIHAVLSRPGAVKVVIA